MAGRQAARVPGLAPRRLAPLELRTCVGKPGHNRGGIVHRPLERRVCMRKPGHGKGGIVHKPQGLKSGRFPHPQGGTGAGVVGRLLQVTFT